MQVVNILLWLVSAGICLACVYGPFDVEDQGHVASKVEAALYNGWTRACWSVGVGYVILACCTGRGGR